MTDEQLFWLGLVAATTGLTVSLVALLFWPHIAWWWRGWQLGRWARRRGGHLWR